MKRLFTILTLLLMLFSCRTHKISQRDLNWQPYKEGDIIVFESNKGEKDTIKIKRIEIYNNPDDPLAIFPNKLQSLFVIADKGILEMDAGKTGVSIHFTIRLGENELKYPNTVLTIKELNKKAEQGKDKYVIEANEFYDNMKDHPFDLRYIYWSKEYGYLGLVFKDNYSWSLISFIRDGKELLQ